MDTKDLRRLLLMTGIGFLTLTALIGIFSVLTGEFGAFQAKVLGTTLTISVVSVCSMAAAAFIEVRRRVGLGITGIATAAFAGVLLIIGIWGEVGDADYWRVTFTMIVVGLTFAYSFLTALPQLAQAYRWCYVVAPVVAGLLSLQVLMIIWEVADGDDWFRILTATSIVVVLLSLIEPILARMSRSGIGSVERLVLTQRHEQVFADAEGRLYKVEPLSAGDADETH